jgi:hypothetical protein
MRHLKWTLPHQTTAGPELQLIVFKTFQLIFSICVPFVLIRRNPNLKIYAENKFKNLAGNCFKRRARVGPLMEL